MAGKIPTIVVIDDSPTSISLYERSASALAVNLSVWHSATECLEYLADHEADLVFLDVFIREKDGFSLLRELRALDHHSDTAVVIVTSKDYAQDRARAKQLGTLEYLVKPLRSKEIREIICKYTQAEPKSAPNPAS